MASKTLTIEIGNEFIKVCEMAKQKNTVMVHHAVSVQTPADSVEDGFVKDINQVSETIKKAMMEEQIIANEVTFVLNSSRVATKEVILPLVKKEKIQELVNMNATEYFPVNIDDYVLSYTILEEKKTKDEQKSRILVFAAPEPMVQSYFDLAKVLGMKVKAVDYAGNSTLQLIKTQIDAKPTLVVQLGMDTTIASVMCNNILQLQRTIPYGESLLLNHVMETRNVKAKVALELLSSAQIVKNTLDEDEATASLKYLISNVNRVIEYYSSRNQEQPLQKIVIIGEGADVLGMDVLFANETSLPAERLTVLKNVESYNRIKVSTSLLKQYMANVGASLNPIHLQPKTGDMVKESSNKQDSIVLPLAVMLIGVVAAVGLAAFPLIKNATLKNEKEDLDAKIEELLPVEQIYAENAVSKNKLNEVEEFYASTANNTEWTLELIEFLEKEMPANTIITAFSVNNGNVSMSITHENTHNKEIAGFITTLQSNKHITDLKFSGYTSVESENMNTYSYNFAFSILDVVEETEEVAGEEAK